MRRMAACSPIWKKCEFVALTIALISILLPQVGFADTCPYIWTKNLKVGSTGADVTKLQQFLNSSADTVVALSGVGSMGKESTTYGPVTARAITKFQEKYGADILTPNGLKKGTGSVGSFTRAKLNSLCKNQNIASSSGLATPEVGSVEQSASVATTINSQADVLTVSVPEQPAYSIAPRDALSVPFTKVTLTAGARDVEVRSVTIKRVGLGGDGAFSDMSLLDEDGTDLSDASLHSDHVAIFKDSFTVSAGTSKTLTVVGNMASELADYDGQVPILRIDAIDASSPVVGTLPVIGTAQAINNSLTIGSATAVLSPEDPASERTKYIGDAEVKFSGIQITADSAEDMRLDSIAWYQSGTAGIADISNVRTVVDGVSFPTEVDGRSYTSTFPNGVVIKKGNTIDVYVEGDILFSGAGRTVEFDIDYSTDTSLTGLAYGFVTGLVPGGNTDTAGHSVFLTSDGETDGDTLKPFFAGSITHISAGTFNYIERR